MRWRTYPKYKDSGSGRLGRIPEHWEARRLRTVCRFAYGDSLAADDRLPGGYSVFGSNGAVGQHRVPNTEGPCLIVGRKGSFGKVVYSEEPCFAIDTTYFVDTSQTNSHLRWLFYCLQWLRLDSFSKDSAVPGLAREDAYENQVPCCQVDEQRAIAAFLDRETERIDALIAKKERFIELLQEKRSALISHAVTKGLDPNGPMKDSGVEWLGEIPTDWHSKRLRFVCQLNPSKSETRHLLRDTEVSFLPMEKLGEDGTLVLDETRTIEQAWEGYTYFRDDDVVVAKITPCFENGKGARVHDLLCGVGFGTTELHVLRAREGMDPGFACYVTLSHPFRNMGAASMYGAAGQQRVPEDFVKDFTMGIPPVLEQRAIAAFLDHETGRVDSIIDKALTAVDRLREYRTALISAAVTGKIDVRNEVEVPS